MRYDIDALNWFRAYNNDTETKLIDFIFHFKHTTY